MLKTPRISSTESAYGGCLTEPRIWDPRQRDTSALVLAAGAGTRLGGSLKACLRVGGATLLERHFRNLARTGIPPSRVTVVYAHHRVRTETERLGGVPVESLHPMAPGTLGSFISGFPEGTTLVLHGDLLWEPSMAWSALAARGDAVVPLDPGSRDPEAMKARVEGGAVVELSKGLSPDSARGESMGMFLFRSGALPELERCCSQAMADLGVSASLDDAVTLLAGRIRVIPVPVPGRVWEEIDTRDDLQRAERLFR